MADPRIIINVKPIELPLYKRLVELMEVKTLSTLIRLLVREKLEAFEEEIPQEAFEERGPGRPKKPKPTNKSSVSEPQAWEDFYSWFQANYEQNADNLARYARYLTEAAGAGTVPNPQGFQAWEAQQSQA